MLPLPWWYGRNVPQASKSAFGIQVGEQVSPAEVLPYDKQSPLIINHFQ